ncbi:RagB/SusD family nutrient uptake outer membrane protein [uncultured Algibacter sp.]|uniref:RagB/SusD family nutrient uptake outer membrane protein n=1 Tax=uncultured Algibacter sp. TaxID=298659 RepID=UPI0026033DC7|nr:RagB/SusD family nutrient uptake outer membrane protein [uncultured Algibacter sp.]
MKEVKKLRYIFLTVFIALAACDDFVEVDPIGPNAGDFFNTEAEYEQALIGAYDLLQATFWNNLLAVSASDDYGSGGDAFNYDQPVVQNVNFMIHSPDDEEQLRSIWQLMYGGLSRVNYLLENKGALDFSGKDEIIAQAYFLRAYYTFELVKFFGNIPLKTEERGGVKRIADSQISATDQFAIERVSSISEVYGLIQEDLKEAIPSLPTTQDLPYKVTKGAAQALLGKAYLYDGKFSDAATILNQVVSSSQYSLTTGDDYMGMFTVSGENGSESVFEIQYTNVEGAGWDCLQCSEGSYFVQFNGPRSPFTDDVFATGWGFLLPSQALYDTFDANDMRRDATILDLRELKALEDNAVYSAPREDTGFYNLKYIPRKAEKAGNANTQELVHQNNYRAIRFADVLLMAAEAEAQSGGSNAEIYLNRVRARAYGDNSNDYSSSEGSLLDAIYEERRKELAGEGHRFFDLVRTGRAVAAFAEYNASKPDGFEDIVFQANKHEVFPIPRVELELAQAEERWGQNPGYSNQ